MEVDKGLRPPAAMQQVGGQPGNMSPWPRGLKKKKKKKVGRFQIVLQTTKKIAFGDVWNDWVHHLCQHDLKNPEGGGKTGTAEDQGCRLPWVNGSVHYLPYRIGFNSVWEHRKQVTLDCRMSPLSLAGCR